MTVGPEVLTCLYRCIMWFNHEGGYIPKTKIWVEKYEPGHPEAQTFSPDYALLSKLQIEAKLHPQVDSEKLFPHLYYDDQIPGGVKFTNELVKAIDLSVEKLKGAGGLNEDQQKRFKDSIRFLEDLEQARRDENEESVRKNMYDKGWRIQHPDIPIIPEPGQDVLPPWPKDITSEQIAEVQKWLDEWDNWFDRWAELDEMGMATKAQNSAVRHHRVTIACQEGIRQLKSRLASGLGPAAPGGSC